MEIRNMEIRKGTTVFLMVLLGFLNLASCERVQIGWFLIAGNRHYLEGRYQEAQVAYLKALELKRYEEWVRYNLGNVYYALGERKAALEEWDRAQGTEDARLRFNVLFNKGVLALDEENWREGEKLFIQALELDPSSYPAKVNLEYATRKIASAQTQASKLQSSPKPQKLDEEGERLLHYIRQKESNRWIASDRLAVEESAEDW
jgi:tetratricopeptide (TPR) repeat protein